MVHRKRPRTNLTLDPDTKERGKWMVQKWRHRSLSQLVDQLLYFAWEVSTDKLSPEEQAESFLREIVRFREPRWW